MKKEVKRNIIGLIILALIFTIALVVEKCYLDYEKKNEEAHFKRFESCMKENNFEYSDALCDYCWELTK